MIRIALAFSLVGWLIAFVLAITGALTPYPVLALLPAAFAILAAIASK